MKWNWQLSILFNDYVNPIVSINSQLIKYEPVTNKIRMGLNSDIQKWNYPYLRSKPVTT